MARRLARLLSPRVLVACLITVALIVLLSLPGSTVRADGTFDSTSDFKLCNLLPADFNGPAPLPGDPNCTGDYSPGAHPDYGFHWDVPAGDYNFATFANFISDDFSWAADEDVDDGTVIGGVRSATTLGLATNPCNNAVYPDFILFDSTTNTSNTVDALAEGVSDRFSNLANDDGDSFYGQADGDSPAVLQYPSFLNTLLDPDRHHPGSGSPNGPEPPISPHARYTGLTQVPPAGDWIFFSILVFEKTQLSPFVNDPDNATHPFARYGRNPDEAGWVHILILNDPTQLVASVSPISDFCSPLVSDTVFLGQVTDTSHGTVNVITSPAADTGIDGEGTHLMMVYGLSIRDTDGDGVENALDTCPFTANVDDPRSTNGADFDMIDPACDPGPSVFENGGDFDLDAFYNSQDNCPLVSNASQGQAESTTTYIAAAPDGGFKHDWIGDACDSEGGGTDNLADGAFLHDMNTDAVCISNNPLADEDGDGWCSLSPGADPDDSDANVTGAPSIDTDGDGSPNSDEPLIGTDPLADCTVVLTIDDNADTVPERGVHDAWPPDFDMNRVINITDVFKVLPPVFGSSTGQPLYSERVDVAPDGVINITDVFKVLPPIFGTSCTP